jgi:hypothetical protein
MGMAASVLLRLLQSVKCTIIRYTCLIKIAQNWNKSGR